MGSAEDHETTAGRNLAVMKLLLQDGRFPEWVVTAAFYRAVHLVEKVFTTLSPAEHSASHEERNERLRRTNQFKEIHKHYRPLYSLSQVARYLADADDVQGEARMAIVMDLEQVRSQIVDHRLARVESAVQRAMTPKARRKKR